jgi:tetratricopeptide (TPR) repeat protein
MGLVEARRAEEALRFLDGWDGPADARVHLVKGLALEEQKRWIEAAAAFSRIGPEDGDLWVGARSNAAYALTHAGKGAEALRTLEEALAARPEETRLQTARAWVLDRLGRSPEAVRGLERAIARREKAGDADVAADLYDALAASLARAGRPAEAVALLRRALAARPRHEGLLFSLGQAQERAGDMDAALAQMRALLVQNPDHAEALNFVGYAWAERGERLEEAERLLLRALELRPENGYFLDSLGWVYYQRGEVARAVATLERAVEAGDAEPTILEHLGDAYRKAGREADAAAVYRRALLGIDAGESQDGPERAAAQRTGIEHKLGEPGSPRPSGPVDTP